MFARCPIVSVGALAITAHAPSVRSAIDCIAWTSFARCAGVSVVAVASAIYTVSMCSAIDCVTRVLTITIYSKITLDALANARDACAMLATFVAVRANTIDVQAENEWFSSVIVKIDYA